jgi:hypothetical protein
MITDLYRIHSVFLKPPLKYFKQKRSTTLNGNVLDVNLKLHISENELDMLQKCKNVIYWGRILKAGCRFRCPCADGRRLG